MMLADLGAEVIKVEHPQGGDPFRTFRGEQYSPNFVAYNRGKRGIQLDLRTDEGRAILLKLVARDDVVLENYRPGIMEKLGLGDDVLTVANARLIHCSITGFGASGPYSARPAYDNVAVALSGIASLQLDPEHPQSSGPTIPDNATGMFACYGILGALYERARSGRGHRVDVNMLEAGIAFIPDPFANWVNMLEEHDVPFAPVNSIADVLDDPQVRHLRTFYRQRHPTEGEITAIHRPVLIDGARDERALPAPALGEHTDAVLAELGYDAGEIAKLRTTAVI